jgi:hypothetical protein
MPELEIQDVPITLQYADYGRDFYIAYFNLVYADTFHFKFTINDKIIEAELNMINKLEMELPENLEPELDVVLEWSIEKDPQVIYIEGFQRDNSDELLDQKIKNLEPETRSFTVPANWLWSKKETFKRAIQVGIMNYNIVDRVCFTISDGAYKSY